MENSFSRSRFWFIQIITCILFFAGINLGATAQTDVVLDFGEPLQYDFGQVVEGDSAVKIFTFKNVGSVPVHFTEMQTTCSCTATEYPKDPVNPGETGLIRIEFDTSEKNGSYAKGVNLIYSGGEVNFVIYATVSPRTGGN